MGAYLSHLRAVRADLPLRARCWPAPTTTPVIYCDVKAVFTNTVPVDAYRGAGRPEATYPARTPDEQVAAREIGIDPVELRRSNFIQPDQFPYQTPVALEYDTGNYQADARPGAGSVRLRGLRGAPRGSRPSAASCAASASRPISRPAASRRRRWSGSLGARAGLYEVGVIRVHPDRLGHGPDRLAQPRPGPRDHLRAARRRQARRADRAGRHRPRRHRQGALRHGHLRLALARGRRLRRSSRRSTRSSTRASGSPRTCWRRASDDIEFDDGAFRVAGTDKDKALVEISLPPTCRTTIRSTRSSRASRRPPSTTRRTSPIPAAATSPRSRSTPIRARVAMVNFAAVDDVGQRHQPDDRRGPGAWRHRPGHRPGAAGERCVYDDRGPAAHAARIMDYCMPRADDLPPFKVGHHTTPCTHNPLGVKGCGEAGAIGAPPAVINAVVDALRRLRRRTSTCRRRRRRCGRSSTAVAGWRPNSTTGRARAGHRPAGPRRKERTKCTISPITAGLRRRCGEAAGRSARPRRSPAGIRCCPPSSSGSPSRPILVDLVRHRGAEGHQGAGQRPHHRRADPPCRRSRPAPRSPPPSPHSPTWPATSATCRCATAARIGGSVANNDPAADYPAAVLGLGATIHTIQAQDRRRRLLPGHVHDRAGGWRDPGGDRVPQSPRRPATPR